MGLGPVPALIVSEIFRQGSRAAAYSTCQSIQWLSNLIVLFIYPIIQMAKKAIFSCISFRENEFPKICLLGFSISLTCTIKFQSKIIGSKITNCNNEKYLDSVAIIGADIVFGKICLNSILLR
ncbi:unnamed protein product [Heterobilharzia americana]|nr:unnamed protein product [Heterobilharzia americana]